MDLAPNLNLGLFLSNPFRRPACQECLTEKWINATVEVRVWTSDGLSLRVRKWEPETMDIWSLAEEITHYIAQRVA